MRIARSAFGSAIMKRNPLAFGGSALKEFELIESRDHTMVVGNNR